MRHAKSLIDAQVWPEAAKKNHAETNAAKQKKRQNNCIPVALI